MTALGFKKGFSLEHKRFLVPDYDFIDIDDKGHETTWIQSHQFIVRGVFDDVPFYWVRITHDKGIYAKRYTSMKKAVRSRNKWLKKRGLPIPD